jgi:Putative metal-binding motif
MMSKRLVLGGALASSLAACGSDAVSFGPVGDHAVLGGPQHTHVEIATDKAVRSVELYLDGLRVGEAPFAPFVVDWSTQPFADGEHRLRGIAYLSDGKTLSGSIEVSLDNTPPTIGAVDHAERGTPLTIPAFDEHGVAALEVHVGGHVLAAIAGEEGFAVPWDEPCGPTDVDIVATDSVGSTATTHATITTHDSRDSDCDGHLTRSWGGDDCDDDKAFVHPGAVDPGGGTFDVNCDGVIGTDADHDHFASIATGGDDCDDDNKDIHPGRYIWGEVPIAVGGETITWTPGNASIAYSTDSDAGYDPTIVIAVNRGGTIELVSRRRDDDVWRRDPLVSGANDAPIALVVDAISTHHQYVLAYGRGKELHVRRWTIGADPQAGVVDEIAATTDNPVGATQLNRYGDLVAARAGSSIWMAWDYNDAWRPARALTGVVPADGPLAIGTNGSLLFVDHDTLTRAIESLSSNPPTVETKSLGPIGAVEGGIVERPSYPNGNGIIYGSAGGLHGRDAGGIDRWVTAGENTAIEHLISDDDRHALAVVRRIGGGKALVSVSFATGRVTTVKPSVDGGDTAVPDAALGTWLVATPGKIYRAVDGDWAPWDPPDDHVDRDCDGED